MKYDLTQLRQCPDIMSKEQLRIVCHISKRTALYLLQSGLIPCKNSGKKTRCYSIKKSDVLAFLKDREKNPERYLAPENWYSPKSAAEPNPYVIRVHPSKKCSKTAMTRYYRTALKAYPDVMDVQDVCEFTGYNRRTVSQWVRKNRLKIIMRTNKFLIPKPFLIEYLCSDWYAGTLRKSKKHLDALWAISEQENGGTQ